MTTVHEGEDLEVPDTTVVDEFLAAPSRYGDAPAVRTLRDEAGNTRTFTWGEFQGQVLEAARGLLTLGLEPGDRVAILSETRHEWSLADLAAMCAGGVTVSVYTTFSPEQAAYVVEDSGSSILFVSDQELFDKVGEVRDRLPGLERVVTFEHVDAGELGKSTLHLDDLRERGREASDDLEEVLEDRVEGIDPRDPATIVYTSGTTGRPKGVVLTHRNLLAAAASAETILEVGPDDVGLGFLPLAHIYQRLSGILGVRNGVHSVFTTPEDLEVDLKEVQPTTYTGVPRIFERMYETVIERLPEEAGPVGRRIFERASSVAREYGRALSRGGEPGPLLRLRHALYDRLVYERLRHRMGARRLRYVTTGAAAIRPDLLHWFRGIGVPILEGYGLTETSAPSNLNRPEWFVPGTVGPPIPGMKQKIGPVDGYDHEAEDDAQGPVGEVLMKGPNVFERYHGLPEETGEAFTEDGWFRSGDVGYFDEDGHLVIVDRLKQIEVLSTGKNVAPVPIEEDLKNSDLVSEAMLVADDRKFPTALVQPAYATLLEVARRRGITFDDARTERGEDPAGDEVVVGVDPDLLAAPEVRALYQEVVDDVNETLAEYEEVGDFRLVPQAWRIETAELTPTLKKKRRVIRENWSDLVEEMYPGD